MLGRHNAGEWGGLAARLVLAVVALFAAARIIDPEARWAAESLRGDRIEHALIVYLLLVCSLRAFPTLSAWWLAAGLVLLGAAVEAAQALPGVPGDLQTGDFMADLAGIALACLPLWARRRRTT
jgi:hypothetical protein